MLGLSPKNLALTQGPEILDQIIKELNSARSTVDIAMAWFTNKQLLSKVSELCDAGIKVRIILAKNDYNSSTALSEIKSKGAQVIYLQGSGYGMMHHKFCLIDGKRAITGSFNWTANAVSNSSENAIFTSDKAIINPLVTEFDKLLGKEVPEKQNINRSDSFDDPFIEQLESITSALIEDYNHDEIESHGYLKSKESNGISAQLKGLFDELLTDFKNSVFKSTTFKERTLVKMDVLWEQKEQSTKLEYETRKSNEESDFQRIKATTEEDIQSLRIKREGLEKEKEEYRFRKEKNTTEIKDLDQEIDKLESNSETKPFWNIQNTFAVIAVIAFWFYLYLFYSSAIYILQYGKIEVERAISMGITPRIEFFDPEALGKLTTKGWVEIFFAFLVVHIPISLALAKMFIKKTWLANLMSYFVAIFIIDFFVAFSISKALHEIKILTEGVQLEQSFGAAILNLDFFKVFIFGALPLMILKFLFQYVQEAYSDSQIELVNNKLSKQIKLSKKQQARLNHENQNLEIEIGRVSNSITSVDDSIQSNKTALLKAEDLLNDSLIQIDSSLNKELEYYESIFRKYRDSIERGSATILLNAMESRISSSLVGWIRFLNEQFSQNVIEERLKQIEIAKNQWIEKIS